MVDDKSRYTDWANRDDIKAELQMDLILILAEHGYPPVPQDDVFKEIFEQAENFKKYESDGDDYPQMNKTSASGGKALELHLIPEGSVLNDVEADDDVRRLIHNMMELYEGTTIMKIVVECQKEYQERYFCMKGNDWRHLIRDYVRKVTERPDLQEEEVFRFSATG